MLVLWVVIPAVAMALGCGCPLVPQPPAAGVLEGDWLTTDEEENNAVVRFDENGVVIGILTQNEEGNFILVAVNNATTELVDSAVTITVPTPLGNAIFIGTLSEDQNTMTGNLGRTIDIGEDITVVIPEGELTLERITDICDLITCDEGEVCENGVCVPEADPCEGVECGEGEVCEDGVCVPEADPCEGVECGEGEVCEDGVCVPEPDPCEGVTCEEGEECVDGVCVPVDPCEGVTCEEGEVCEDGICVPESGGGDPVAGQAYYEENCEFCHGPEGTGDIGPSLIDITAEELLDVVDGTHGGVDPITEQEAEDLEAYLAS
jgi:hypothetical protein